MRSCNKNGVYHSAINHILIVVEQFYIGVQSPGPFQSFGLSSHIPDKIHPDTSPLKMYFE